MRTTLKFAFPDEKRARACLETPSELDAIRVLETGQMDVKDERLVDSF